MKQDGCKKVAHGQRQGRPTAPASRERRVRGQDAGPDDRSATTGIDTNAAELPLAGAEVKAQGRLLPVRGRHRQRTRCRLYKDVAAALPNAKLYGAGRRRASGVHQPEEGRHPGRRRHALQVHGRDARPRRSTRPRASSSSRPTSRSTTTRNPDPYAIYGYEAMSSGARHDQALPATRATTRATVLKALFATKDRQSRARHVLDRRERRHDADRLRPLQDRQDGKLAFDEDDQGAGS